MRFAPLLALLIFASCGADGEPAKPGVSVTGEAQFGVVKK